MKPGEIYNFSIEKDRLNGKITPEVLRDSMDRWVDDYGEVTDMIVIYAHPVADTEGYETISVGYTNMQRLKLIGYLEWAKKTVIDEMFDDKE